jgi:DNA-binding winged helix-turn-helix (wHTH) protein
MVYLAKRFGQLVPVTDLIDDVWQDSETGFNTVQKTISNLRRYLARLGITDLSIDGSIQGHHRLHEP